MDKSQSQKCICETCELDRIPSGCNTSIHDQEVVKGVGTVNCKRYVKNKKIT